MKTIQVDKRGFVKLFIFKEKEYLLIYTKAGFHRGGHLHNNTQLNVLLEGSINWNGEIYSAISIIKSLPNVLHSMTSITDSLMLEWKEL